MITNLWSTKGTHPEEKDLSFSTVSKSGLVPPPPHLETLEVTQREAEALEGRPGGILIRSDGVIHSGTFQILWKSLEIGTVYHSSTLYI